MIVYKWQKHNKLNGTLFYCNEYAYFLKTTLYIVGINDEDLLLVKRIFNEKYKELPPIIPVSIVELYQLKLSKTILLDIKSFYGLKEFLGSGEIHVFSNESHEMDRSKSVTYYGSYPYQNYDVFNYLKLNFDMFKEVTGNGKSTFVSGPYIPNNCKDDLYKKHDDGVGNIFEYINKLVYVHTSIDTNNRIIPEAFYHGVDIEIDDKVPDIVDSITLRYNDIKNNGLSNYTLTKDDAIVKAVTT